MSTRTTRTADKQLNEKHQKILKALLARPDNKHCVDCKRKDPRWASWNLGIFFCIRCSGVHRSLGTHISRVKSVDLDTWTPEQVDNMIRWGNARANKYWEANLKEAYPTESAIENFIRQKYEHKRWAMPGPIPDPSTLDDKDETSISESVIDEAPKQDKPLASTNSSPKSQIPSTQNFASLDVFLSPSSPDTTSSVPAPQLHGADFFGNDMLGAPPTKQTSHSAPVTPMQSRPDTPTNQNQGSTLNSKHNDIKSSILSLYNQPRPQSTGPTLPSLGVQNNLSFGTGLVQAQQPQQQGLGYASQLSGLSWGSSIPAPVPTQQPDFALLSNPYNSSPTTNNEFSAFAAAVPQQQNTPTWGLSVASQPMATETKKTSIDAFADLANFGK